MGNLIFEYFEATVAAHPDKIAVSDGITNYTFSQLKDLAECCAVRIRTFLSANSSSQRVLATMKSQVPIGVLAERCSETLPLFLGVLYSGNYYVPLNKELPSDKLQKIIQNSGMSLLIGREKDLKDILIPDHTVSFLSFETLTGGQDDKGLADEIRNEVVCRNPDPYLYMIYTSGSTGEPKGVLKSHTAMRSFLDAYVERFGFSDAEILGNQTPFFFDASAKDVYLTLKTGMTMEIIPQELFSFPPKLIQYLNDKKVTFVSWVPSALCFVTQLGTFREVLPETLKKVFFVGETFPMKQFRKWQEALPELQYVNLYGASEIAGISCYYEAGCPEAREHLPIGKPLGNCRVFLVDTEPVSDAAEEKTYTVITEPRRTGEIFIQSDALAAGYYEDPQKTARAFVDMDGVRTFRSGDMAWYDEEGNLNFAARSDSQIKHMGYRIELGEIEEAAGGLPGVVKSCCLYNQEKRRIVLFVQMEEPCDGKLIRNQLEHCLAAYMVPQKVIVKETFPMNANGKTDRQKLKEEI